MVILYSKACGETFEALMSSIADAVPSQQIKICRGTGELLDEIRRPGSRKAIVVLLVDSQEDFRSVLNIRDQLWDVKIILIMHSSHGDIIRQGHLLNPRFISACDGNYLEAASVLKRMIDNRSAFRTGSNKPA